MTSKPARILAWCASLERGGDVVGLLPIRALLCWEYLEAGLEKYRGENWFGSIALPAPFSLFPADFNWTLSMALEIAGALCLLLGLATRFFAAVLLLLTVVATAAVHWPEAWSSFAELWMGYAITDQGYGNFKLPLLFAAMLWPLVVFGPGRLSLDALFRRGFAPAAARGAVDPAQVLRVWSVVLLVAGIAVAWLVPAAGLALALAGIVLLARQGKVLDA
ncbi:HvfX family Cu-binding RiPP maturation protein [[Pseudomonas] boreopolis]|uniref:HvfX family Cu-binding RiPP maturation protein n=1 Tax=Xanthomonas boreopolis TaxID=86183 RepID=UPI00112C0688